MVIDFYQNFCSRSRLLGRLGQVGRLITEHKTFSWTLPAGFTSLTLSSFEQLRRRVGGARPSLRPSSAADRRFSRGSKVQGEGRQQCMLTCFRRGSRVVVNTRYSVNVLMLGSLLLPCSWICTVPNTAAGLQSSKVCFLLCNLASLEDSSHVELRGLAM